MTGAPGAHTNRPELVAVHGYDTKFAMRALRLGFQGIELLTDGRITLPVPEPERSLLRSVRRGEQDMSSVVAQIDEAEAQLTSLAESSGVPDQPDRRWVNDWLHQAHLRYWSIS